jgi:D-tyrosyl-tRNA(Tyr) deacylase
MRAVVQRVSEAAVSVAGAPVAAIGSGLLVCSAWGQGDADQDAVALAAKVVNLRIFADEAGQMNRSVLETAGAVLVVSQFTLYGDARKGAGRASRRRRHPPRRSGSIAASWRRWRRPASRSRRASSARTWTCGS